MLPTIEPTRIEHDGSYIDCSLVPWDGAIFGFPVAQVTDLVVGDAWEAVTDAFEAWCAGQDVRLATCRLDHSRLRDSLALEAAGFRFIETVYRPRLDALGGVAAPEHALEIVPASNDDVAAIEASARSSFSTGRFLLDERLDPGNSHERYATWVRNSIADPHHEVLGGWSEDDLVGFFVVEDGTDGSAYWHLTAIAPEWQGRGMGMSLWRTMIRRHHARGASSIETTISGHNLAALNLYARLGFSFASSQMTFHLVRPAGTLSGDNVR